MIASEPDPETHCWAPECVRRPVGGPMYDLRSAKGELVYSCAEHFLLLRKRSDFQRRRLRREAKRQMNK